jgi:hypothetical protein
MPKVRKERVEDAHVLYVSSACVSSWKNVMRRPLNFLLTASVFSTLFIGLALASAVATKALHEQIAARPSLVASPSIVGPFPSGLSAKPNPR